MTFPEMQALAEITDKAQVIDHLTKGFAHAREALEAVDSGRRWSAPGSYLDSSGRRRELVLFVGGDMHEHLGQLIAYARTNQIVPPWSR